MNTNLFETVLISLAMYDNEPQPPVEPPVEPQKPAKPAVFTQDELNKFLAEDRRKTESKFAAKYESLESAYKEALTNQSLSSEQRAQLEGKLEDLQKTYRSKEQQLEHEKKTIEDKYTKEVTQLSEKAKTWEQKFKDTLTDRALQDAAVKNDAFNADQIRSLLRPMTKIVEKTDENGNGIGEYHPVVDLTDIDTKTGEPIITRRTPEDAVKRMKELPSQWGNLFKSNVVSGIGAGSATGSGMSGKGYVDPKNMSPEAYMELRRQNPSALGLR